MKPCTLLACAGILVGSTAANAQDRYLMAINSASEAPGKRIMLFSPVDGTLINDNFIHESSVGGWGGVVKGIEQVDDFIFITLQAGAVVHKYDTAGNFIATLGAGYLSNIRGFAHADGVLYITNASNSAQGAPANSIAKLDLDGNYLGSFPVGSSPFSVLMTGSGAMLVGHSGTADIRRYDLGGA